MNTQHLIAVACMLLLPPDDALGKDQTAASPITASLKPCDGKTVPEITSQQLSQRSLDALHIADVERAAELAFDALCRSIIDKEGDSAQTERAADAIERLLEADRIDLAKSIGAEYRVVADSDPAGMSPSHLRLVVAQARTLSYQDKNPQALAFRLKLQQFLDIAFGEFSSVAIENRLRIANLRTELGDVSTSLLELDRLCDIAVEQFPSDDNLRWLILESYSLTLALNGREHEALSKLREIRGSLIASFGTDDRRIIDVDEQIASVLIRSEEIEEALKVESYVFLWRAKHLPQSERQTLRSLWRLGYLFVVNQRAETAYALLIYVQKKLETTNTEAAKQFLLQTQSRIASIFASKGDYEAAAELWRRVYQGDRELLGDNAADTQIEATNYALALMHLGRVERACELLTSTLDTQTSSHPDDAWSTKFTKISYGRCLLETKRPEAIETARQYLMESWEELVQHAGERSPHALIALATLAKAELLSRHRRVAKQLLSLLLATSEQVREAATSGVPFRDSTITTWVEGKTATGEQVPGYRDLALLHAQDDELERALRISELARDRALRDRFAEQEWRRRRLPNNARQSLNELLDQIQDLDERIAVEAEIIERVRLESERTLAVAQRGRLEQDLRERLHLAEPTSAPPTLDDLRERLDADTALVSVLHSGDTWWALVISRSDPARIVEFQVPDLGRNASAWVRRLRGDPVRAWPVAGNRLVLDDLRPDGATGPFLTVDELAQRLSTGLLLPLVNAVGKARRVVFVGDDELVGIPLQALPLASGLALDRFEFSYAPSLTTYFRWQGPARQGFHSRDLLAIGAVDYRPIAPPATDDPISVGVQFAENHPLPFAREEIDAITAQFPGDRTRAWIGSQASKSTLRRASRTGELLRYRYVHFAAHAWAQPDRPESSAIVLAGSREDLPTQRALTAAELAGLQMGSDLIVLSACDTGVGRFAHGQGLLGLAYAGLAAGNRAALLSLWPIADDTTAQFMERLYANLRGGTDPVAALASTQREFRRSGNPRLSDPAVWAPFVLYGGY